MPVPLTAADQGLRPTTVPAFRTMGTNFEGNARYNGGSNQPVYRRILLADDKLYKAEYLGSGTFVISKPKRKKIKMRQSQLKNPQRGSRK